MIRIGTTALVLLVATALLGRAFAHVDPQATLRAVMLIGPLAPLALVAFLVSTTLDALGIRILLHTLGRDVPLSRLLPIRIATEALHLTAPGGFLVADSATATLLAKRCGVPVAEGAALAVARKWLVMRAHAGYLMLGAALGLGWVGALSLHSAGGRWVPWAVAASALAPLFLSLGLGAGFHGGSALSAAVAFLAAKTPFASLRRRIERWGRGAAAGDVWLTRIGAARRATWTAAAAFFACWLAEALDTAVILRLVGVPADFAFAMAAEVSISMLRSIGNLAPAGLGVQDAGYATLLPILGTTPDAAAAFVVIKRGKELVWIAAGYVLLAVLRRFAPRQAVRAERDMTSCPPAGAVARASA